MSSPLSFPVSSVPRTEPDRRAPAPPPDPTPTPGPGLITGASSCPATLYLSRLAPTGRRVQATALAQMAGWVSSGRADATELPWGELRYAHTLAIRAHLAETYAPATANRMLAALRGVLREAWRLGQVPSEEFHRAIDLPTVRGQRLPAGRRVSAAELAACLASCGPTPGGVRDAALLGVLYGGGLRRCEATGLDLVDLEPDPGRVTVRHGKGATARLVYLPSGGLAALAAWVTVRGEEPGPLFVPVRRGGTLVPGQRLTGQAVRAILHRRAETARVPAFGPHDLRRTVVGDLLDAGVDLATVARICGHASPTTTARYDRRDESAQQHAATLLHIPYCPPTPEEQTVEDHVRDHGGCHRSSRGG